MADPWTILSPTSQRSGSAVTSVLGPEVSVNGTISSDGAIRIEGRVNGDVTARTVILAQGASIKGGVTADVATIEGALKGPLHAREARLTGTARVEGEILHSVLVVEPGAVFDGYSRRAAAPAVQPGKAESAPKT